jgi:hypothetical protein
LKDRVTLGVDFDGVIRFYPVPFRWWFDFVSPNDLLIRAHLGVIRGRINSFLIRRFPMMLNRKLIDYLNYTWRGSTVLISGRCVPEDRRTALRVLSGKLKPDRVVFRETCSEHEEKYKERAIRDNAVDVYVEDRPFVRGYLASHLPTKILSPREFWEWAEGTMGQATAKNIRPVWVGREE